MSQFWPKTIIFNFSKIHIFGFFKGFWRSNWNSKTNIMILIDHNKCPSSEKSDEKCILRKPKFHRILPIYSLHHAISDLTSTSWNKSHRNISFCLGQSLGHYIFCSCHLQCNVGDYLPIVLNCVCPVSGVWLYQNCPPGALLTTNVQEKAGLYLFLVTRCFQNNKCAYKRRPVFVW